MATILLVTATYIKDYTPVNPNVDEKYIRIAIEEAQKIHIREYIGSGLYGEIIGQVNNNNLTTLNTTLLDNYIIPALKWWTLVEVIPFLTYKLTNKSIVTKNSDNSSTVERTQLDFLTNTASDKAQYHTQRLIDYLMEYSDEYPLYDNPGDGFDTIIPRSNSYDSGIWLGQQREYISYEEKFEKRYKK